MLLPVSNPLLFCMRQLKMYGLGFKTKFPIFPLRNCNLAREINRDFLKKKCVAV